MPVLKHARKKLRQDKIRTLKNKKVREFYKSSFKKAQTSPTEKNLASAFSAIDKAVKLNIIHANKAARLKSSLTRSEKGKTEKAEAKTEKVEVKREAAKPAVKKAAVKKKATKKASK